MEKRRFGRTGHMSTVAIFGAAAFYQVTQAEADVAMERVIAAGVNHVDVAPSYGMAEKRLEPWLARERDRFFLGCKTQERSKQQAAAELRRSLERLRVDAFDLYQLHAITTLEEVEQVFAKDGAMETFLKAKEQGKVRYLGFSAHSEEAAHAAMDRYDFDSILFPLSFPIWIKEDFGSSVHKRAKEANRGILAIKAMAHQRYDKG